MLCEKRYSRAGIGRHLGACHKRAVARETGGDNPGQETVKSFHISVEDRYNPRYWMHLEMPRDLELKVLDVFLRRMWLECCEHLSAFYISGVTYQVGAKDWFSDFGGPPTEDMGFAAGQVLRRGQRFTYEYDFGTTTELSLRVFSEIASGPQNQIRLLAVNDPPRFVCYACRKVAADVICLECSMEAFPNPGPGFLCHDCNTGHGCDDMMYLPVVNSPRFGLCGYVG